MTPACHRRRQRTVAFPFAFPRVLLLLTMVMRPIFSSPSAAFVVNVRSRFLPTATRACVVVYSASVQDGDDGRDVDSGDLQKMPSLSTAYIPKFPSLPIDVDDENAFASSAKTAKEEIDLLRRRAMEQDAEWYNSVIGTEIISEHEDDEGRSERPWKHNYHPEKWLEEGDRFTYEGLLNDRSMPSSASGLRRRRDGRRQKRILFKDEYNDDEYYEDRERRRRRGRSPSSLFLSRRRRRRRAAEAAFVEGDEDSAAVEEDLRSDDDDRGNENVESSMGVNRRRRPRRRPSRLIPAPPDPSVDSPWPTLREFKKMLKNEAKFRLEVVGPWASEALRNESIMRLELYKAWLHVLDEGLMPENEFWNSFEDPLLYKRIEEDERYFKRSPPVRKRDRRKEVEEEEYEDKELEWREEMEVNRMKITNMMQRNRREGWCNEGQDKYYYDKRLRKRERPQLSGRRRRRVMLQEFQDDKPWDEEGFYLDKVQKRARRQKKRQPPLDPPLDAERKEDRMEQNYHEDGDLDPNFGLEEDEDLQQQDGQGRPRRFSLRNPFRRSGSTDEDTDSVTVWTKGGREVVVRRPPSNKSKGGFTDEEGGKDKIQADIESNVNNIEDSRESSFLEQKGLVD